MNPVEMKDAVFLQLVWFLLKILFCIIIIIIISVSAFCIFLKYNLHSNISGIDICRGRVRFKSEDPTLFMLSNEGG